MSGKRKRQPAKVVPLPTGLNVSKLAREQGVTRAAIRKRLKRGWYPPAPKLAPVPPPLEPVPPPAPVVPPPARGLTFADAVALRNTMRSIAHEQEWRERDARREPLRQLGTLLTLALLAGALVTLLIAGSGVLAP